MSAMDLTGILAGRLALITGAGSGIGAAIAEKFARAGARVVLTDRDGDACAAIAGFLHSEGFTAHAYPLDVTDSTAIQALAAEVGAQHGDLDILANNAGVLVRRGIDDPRAGEIFRNVMDVNVHGAFAMVQAFLPALRRTKGCIVNTTSGAAFVAQPNCIGYSPSKAALRMLTQTLAVDLGADGIRVNAVAPGVIDTPMTAATRADPTRLAAFVKRIPAGRIGQPEEIATVALFLASPLASYVNGVTLPVDGGFLAG
jgi:meso-butanediol dehydrogenase / (S,S)-butanediol dehydrogenase / diacetyl reductase